MKSIAILVFLAIIVMAVTPVIGSAQRAGFQIGIAPPGRPPGPPSSMAVSSPTGVANGTFRMNPALVGPAFPHSHHFQPAAPLIPLVPNFPTVIVPNTVLFPGQTVLPPTPVSPSSNIFFPANPIQPSPPFSPFSNMGGPVFPAPGMPRAEVIQRFGPPSVTVITSTGETLYFPGGASVIIQNGQVVGSK
jgi:hypothetical protein